MKKFFYLYIILFTFSPSLAQKDYNFSNKLQLARSYLNNRQFQKAEILFESLDKIQPLNSNIITSLNSVYLQLKKYNKSITYIKSKISLSPTNINFYGILGNSFFTKGAKDSAYSIWKKALTLNPNSEINYRIISNYMIQNRAFDQAVGVLRLGKNHSLNPIVFSYELANLQSVLMKFSDAAIEYCEIITRDPRQLNTVKNRLSKFSNKKIVIREIINAVEQYSESKDSDISRELLAYLFYLNGNGDKSLKIIVEMNQKHNENGKRIFEFSESAFRDKNFEASMKGYQYLLNNLTESPFKLSSQIGFIRSKLQLLNNKYKNPNNWKTITLNDTSGAYEFRKLADQFMSISEMENISPFHKIESLYNAAIIYKEKILDFERAKSCFHSVVNNSSNSNFGRLALIGLGDISIIENNLLAAEKYFNRVKINSKKSEVINNTVSLKIAKIKFWQNKFKDALNLLNQISLQTKENSANDAIELSILINTLKTDSSNSHFFSKGCLFIAQNNIDGAIDLFEKDTTRAVQLIIRELAKFKLAELYLAKNDYKTAINYLKRLSNDNISKLYSDEALFLLGNAYLNGLKSNDNAKTIFEKLLAKYPNSIYFSQSRKIINSILIKENNTL